MRGERVYHGKEEDRVGISVGFTDVFDLMQRVMQHIPDFDPPTIHTALLPLCL